MSEKRVKLVIDKKGNYKIETLEGFDQTECHNTVEALASAIGGSVTDEGDKDSYRRNASAEVYDFLG